MHDMGFTDDSIGEQNINDYKLQSDPAVTF
jgi:hypothetical protein